LASNFCSSQLRNRINVPWKISTTLRIRLGGLVELHSLSDADQQAVMEKLSGSWNLFVFGLRKNQRVTRLSTAMPEWVGQNFDALGRC
jgi:hypothetical protein